MLFDLPWPVEEPHRGWALRDGGVVVGFLGAHFSTRRIAGSLRAFACTSSWIVKESHRRASLELVRPLLALRSHTIVNHAPSDVACAIFTRLGLVPFETGQILLPPWPGAREAARTLGTRVLTAPDAVRAALDPDGRRVFDDLRGTLAAQIGRSEGGRHTHVIATRSPWKPRLHVAHVQYASDWELFWRHPARIGAAFSPRLRTLGLRVDARHLRGRPPRFAVAKPLPEPRLFRPAAPEITPAVIDGLYSEFVGQRWT